ncbi:MAG: damage-inducible protein DinB [Chloroflexi bacterium]|nr:MAG: damage-inducible protein DinB [Chloroflexota bacterium]
MNEVFLDLYSHNLWANERLLDACESLPDEVLDASAMGTYGTVRDTLAHLLAAEGRYLSAIRGHKEPPADALKEGGFPGIAALKEHARASGAALKRFAADARSNEIKKIDRGGQHFEIPLSTFFAQAINHGTEHRAHVCTILTQQGIEPPRIDVWGYWETAGPTGRAYRRSRS